MPVLAVPGSVAPAPPPVTVEVPESWAACPGAGHGRDDGAPRSVLETVVVGGAR
jgi:hypothetical protein